MRNSRPATVGPHASRIYIPALILYSRSIAASPFLPSRSFQVPTPSSHLQTRSPSRRGYLAHKPSSSDRWVGRMCRRISTTPPPSLPAAANHTQGEANILIPLHSRTGKSSTAPCIGTYLFERRSGQAKEARSRRVRQNESKRGREKSMALAYKAHLLSVHATRARLVLYAAHTGCERLR